MGTPVASFQYNPATKINYLGNDPEYWPDGGPVVVPELHTARVSAFELDALELASHGKIVFTTNGTEKALEVRALGVADPAVLDTTVLDTGSNVLQLKSDAETRITADTIAFNASSKFQSTVKVANASTPTFHHIATPDRMIMGTGVLDPNDAILSGSFLTTTADSFRLGHDSASIRSTAGADSRIRFEAAQAHEFFVGQDAATQSPGTGAIEITPSKVTIRKDVDLLGTINSVTTDATTLNVEDQVIRLAYTNDPATANTDALLEHSKTGLTIDTVPGSYTEDKDYMSKFKGSDGSKLFVDDTAQTINVQKAQQSGLFTKEMAFYLNKGARSAGVASSQSRLEEPFWNLSGGALHMSHTVPNGNGKARKFSLGFRITDTGNFEMVRLTKNLAWDNAATKYVPDATVPDTAKVVAKYVNVPPV